MLEKCILGNLKEFTMSTAFEPHTKAIDKENLAEIAQVTQKEEKINTDGHFSTEKCDYQRITRGLRDRLMKFWNVFAKYLWPGNEKSTVDFRVLFDVVVQQCARKYILL